MYVILLNYVKPLEEINKLVPAHREFLDRHYSEGHFICSGAQNPRTGGVILCKADSRAEVDSIIGEDPFYQNGASEYEVIEFSPTKHAEGFKQFCP